MDRWQTRRETEAAVDNVATSWIGGWIGAMLLIGALPALPFIIVFALPLLPLLAVVYALVLLANEGAERSYKRERESDAFAAMVRRRAAAAYAPVDEDRDEDAPQTEMEFSAMLDASRTWRRFQAQAALPGPGAASDIR